MRETIEVKSVTKVTRVDEITEVNLLPYDEDVFGVCFMIMDGRKSIGSVHHEDDKVKIEFYDYVVISEAVETEIREMVLQEING